MPALLSLGLPHGDARAQIQKAVPAQGGIEYRYEKDDCLISLQIGRSSQGDESAGLSGVFCRGRSYPQKLALMASVVDEARREGHLGDLRRVGPGPGDELCKGEPRRRLVELTLARLSDPQFVRRHPRLVAGARKNRIDTDYLFREADPFREYKALFERLGYALAVEEFEGVVYDKVKPEERPQQAAGLPAELLVPCLAMVYFRVERR